MNTLQFKDKYPVYWLTVAKSNGETVDDILQKLKVMISQDPQAACIAEFDQYAQTQRLNGEIVEGMVAAKNLVFCFGAKIESPHVLAVRPRSIGVADMGEHFHISFMEAPSPQANEKLKQWVMSLQNQEASV